MHRVIFVDRWYNLNRLQETYGIPIQPCPEKCGGVRFQWQPNAKCRGKTTCWRSKRVRGSELVTRCKYFTSCSICSSYFRFTNKHDNYCTPECEKGFERTCPQCLQPLWGKDVTQKQIISGTREKFRRGTADEFPYTTYAVQVHKSCLRGGEISRFESMRAGDSAQSVIIKTVH